MLMRKTIKLILVASVLLLPVLSGQTATTTAGANIAAATGGGHYLISGVLDVQFAFAAIQHADGSFSGVFHHSTGDETGTVDFDARVTCLAVDKELGRAWIGGVIVANRSTSPDFQAAIHQPGRDIWFRVLDGGEGKDKQQSRTTFVGFEGIIPSSAAYCATRPWPDGNARTWPVTEGTVTVH
jgi:hypothetical protein